MNTYTLAAEDLWDDVWEPIGRALTVDADTPGDALSQLAPVGFNPGVVYRIRIYLPDGGGVLTTPPATAPDRPTLS